MRIKSHNYEIQKSNEIMSHNYGALSHHFKIKSHNYYILSDNFEISQNYWIESHNYKIKQYKLWNRKSKLWEVIIMILKSHNYGTLSHYYDIKSQLLYTKWSFWEVKIEIENLNYDIKSHNYELKVNYEIESPNYDRSHN